jgi:hypothetical protein
MELSEGYLKIIAAKLIKHKENWKDNPSKYSGLWFIITPLLQPAKRQEFNTMLAAFYEDNNHISADMAEKLCFYLSQPFLMGQKLYIKQRVKAKYGDFDTIRKTLINPMGLERGLRNITFWLLIEFKNICKEKGIKFDEADYSISDISRGATSYL